MKKLKQIVRDYPITLTASVNGLAALFGPAMTRPAFATFLVLLAGAILVRGRHTVTRMIFAAGIRQQHHSRFHRFFSRASWAMDELWRQYGLWVNQLFLVKEVRIRIGIDDTAQRKTGAKIDGAAVVYDNRPAVHKDWSFSWGISWVVASYLVELPLWKGHVFALPALARRYRPRAVCEKQGRPFKTKPELALEIMQSLASWFLQRRFLLHIDGGYASEHLQKLPEGVDVVGRVRWDAAIYELPRVAVSGRRGRPRLRGPRLAKPRELAQREQRPWESVTLRSGRRCEVNSWCVLWWTVHRTRPIRLVASRSLKPNALVQFFYTTDLALTAAQVLQEAEDRWPIELMFREAKERMGFEEPQCRTEKAVERTTPFLLLVMGLVQTWFLSQQDPSLIGFRPRWWRARRRKDTPPSFSEMLAAMRRELLHATFSSRSASKHDLLENLQRLIEQASFAA